MIIVTQPGLIMSDALSYAVDVFAIFKTNLWFSGWIFDPEPILLMELVAPGLSRGRITPASYGIASPDVASGLGEAAANARFDETFAIDPESFSVADNINLQVARRRWLRRRLPSRRAQASPAA